MNSIDNKELKIPAYKVENESKTLKNEEDSVVSILDKKIGGLLKKTSGNRLFSLPFDLSLPDVSKEILRNHEWSMENWALWCAQIVKDTFSNKININIHRKDIKNIFYEKIITKKFCPAGQLAQIVKSLGSLDCYDAPMKDWIFSLARKNIPHFSPKEFYLFCHGAKKIFSREEMKIFFTEYSYYYKTKPDLEKDFQLNLKPQGIASILKTCIYSECKTIFADSLLNMAKDKLNTFAIEELIDLIAGLNPHFFEKPEIALQMLQDIEKILASKKLEITSSLIAMEHFALVGYIPDKILPSIADLIEDKNVSLWNKIGLLSSTAILGLKENYSFAKLCKFLVKEIYENDPNSKNTNKFQYETLYEEDLVRLLYCAAVFFNEDENNFVIPELVQYVVSRSDKLSPQLRTMLVDSLRALNYYQEIRKIENPILPVTTSRAQVEITYAVKNWFNQSSLKNIQIFPEGDVKGRKVDILITGFKKMGLKQKDIVIEIDGPSHFACNQQNHFLGKNYIRKKSIMNLGLEIRAFNLQQHGVAETTAKVLNFLENKWKQYWGQTKF